MPAAGDMLIQQIFPSVTGLPEDTFVNTWHFTTVGGGSPTTTDFNDAADKIEDFWNDVHAPATAALGTEISTTVNRSACRLKGYRLASTPPRVPVIDRVFTLVATGATVMYPNEVALCLSVQGTPISGVVQARRRGRMYLGPLHAGGAVSSGDVVPQSATITKMTSAASWMAAQTGPKWCVYSRADDAMIEIQEGWVDNAYDTQRRRGKKAAVRTLWT